MSYITWRRENEDRVMSYVSKGNLRYLPAWKDFASIEGEIRNGLIYPVVCNMMEKEDMTPITFSLTFLQYLYETHHISTLDVNLFTKMIITAETEFIDTLTEMQSFKTASALLHKIREMLPEESKKHLDIVVDKMAEMGSEFNDDDSEDDEST